MKNPLGPQDRPLGRPARLWHWYGHYSVRMTAVCAGGGGIGLRIHFTPGPLDAAIKVFVIVVLMPGLLLAFDQAWHHADCERCFIRLLRTSHAEAARLPGALHRFHQMVRPVPAAVGLLGSCAACCSSIPLGVAWVAWPLLSLGVLYQVAHVHLASTHHRYLAYCIECGPGFGVMHGDVPDPRPVQP